MFCNELYIMTQLILLVRTCNNKKDMAVLTEGLFRIILQKGMNYDRNKENCSLSRIHYI